MKKAKKNALFEEILNSLSKYIVIAVAAIVIIVCFSGVRFVKSGNVALILRFGNLVGNTYEEQVHEPGLLLAFPYVIDEVILVPTGSVVEQKVTTHYTQGNMTGLRSNGYVITGDQNIAVISATVKYTITDPVSYALCVNEMESIINACVSNAMVEAAACVSVDDILTSGKEAYAKDVTLRAQRKLDTAQTGITVKTLELTKVSMPNEVSTVYENVNAATVQASTELENAKQYRETIIPQAQSQADATVAAANKAYSQSLALANSELVEFWGLVDEYKQHPEVVKTRVYNEKFSQIISKIGKVKIVQDGDSKIFLN